VAYKITNDKVVQISPPNRLSKYQSKKLDSTKTPQKILDLVKRLKNQEFKIDGRAIRVTY